MLPKIDLFFATCCLVASNKLPSVWKPLKGSQHVAGTFVVTLIMLPEISPRPTCKICGLVDQTVDPVIIYITYISENVVLKLISQTCPCRVQTTIT